ncbi:hypothetical protein BTM25_24200 [Actinomadura rubteroloni]|uniref:VWA domain-containing protein n=1 Tax=Actinomadura rubteroloni TaxID=1926885 RepID=A0A2P4UFI6_9ACTN|nr:hypothetical protein [Actinomadura rubteroloni]POM23795.1 hypothetical protein BTM25_24200 [Actinomadura rubteroloni]
MTRHGRLPGVLVPSRLLGSPTQRPPAASGLHASALGHPGHPATTPTLLIAMFDNSGSVVTPGGTDPTSNRFAEVDAAFSLVARHGTRRELGAVLHFDTPSRGDVPPLPLQRRNLPRLRAGLRLPHGDAGCSVLGPSLTRATALADAHPDHATTLVVLSDFLLLDDDPAKAMTDLAAFPGDVHAVVLGNAVPASRFASPISVTPITRDARPGAVARALLRSLTTHRPGSAIPGEPP